MNAADRKAPLQDEASLQLDQTGNLSHLLTLNGIDRDRLTDILDDAETCLTAPGVLPARSQALAGRTVAVRMAALDRVTGTMAGR